MNHESRTQVLLLLLGLPIAGCVLPDAKLGEGAESTGVQSDDSGDSSSFVTVTTDTDSATGAMEPVTPGIGAPCEHWEPGEVPDSRLLTFPHSDCAGQICLYADSSNAPRDPCTTDEECNGDNPENPRFVCNAESECELSLEFFTERSMCSGFCESDADCVTDEATSCQTGFRCEPMTSLGEACCRPVCVCNDDLDEAIAHDLDQNCRAGTQEGCCDALPGNGLCPG